MQTRHPDGTADRVFVGGYYNSVPLTIVRKYDKNGREILSERRYSYIIKARSAVIAMRMTVVRTGDKNPFRRDAVKEGQTVTLTYTEQDMQLLLNQARKSGKLAERFDEKTYLGRPLSPQEFAIHIAECLHNDDYGVSSFLFGIATVGRGEFSKLPGTVTVM